MNVVMFRMMVLGDEKSKRVHTFQECFSMTHVVMIVVVVMVMMVIVVIMFVDMLMNVSVSALDENHDKLLEAQHTF